MSGKKSYLALLMSMILLLCICRSIMLSIPSLQVRMGHIPTECTDCDCTCLNCHTGSKSSKLFRTASLMLCAFLVCRSVTLTRRNLSKIWRYILILFTPISLKVKLTT